MFDVDPKWAELVKERGNLPHDLQKRLSGNERSSVNKGKSPGRPPMMPSPTSQQSANTANLAATSMASGLNFPLGNLNNSLLSGLSLGNFDPKNPLLMPFGGLTNLGALGGLGNLGNLGNMSLTNSLFANLAGLGLPSLAGMEAALNAQVATNSAAAAAAAAAAADANNPVVSSAAGSSGKNTASSSSNMSGGGGGSGGGNSSKSRSSKLDQPTTSGKSSAGGPSTLSAVSSASLPTPSPFPFLFTNPSLLYTPLTLSGLNPFSMQSGGVSSAYESLAQCGLLNPPTSTASTVRKPTSSSSSSRQREAAPESSTSSSSSSSSTTKRKESEKKSRYSVDPAVTLQQYTDMAALHGGEERRRIEQQQQQQQPQPQQQHEKRETAMTEQADVMAADLSEKKTERKSKEQEMKEALEHLSRTSAELVTRNIDDVSRSEKLPSKNRSSTDSNQNSDQQQQQRSTPSVPPPLEVTLEPVAKKMRIEMDTNTKSSVSSSEVPTVEIEAMTRPSPATPTKATQQPPASSQEETSSTPSVEANTAKKEANEATTTSSSSSTSSSSVNTTSPSTQNTGAKSDGGKLAVPEAEEDGKGGTKAPKKARSGKRLTVEPPPERKNLRSSAGRQARAAAERQARMEGEMQHSEQQQQQQQQQDSHVAGE